MKIQLTVTTNGPMFNGRFKNMYKNALVQAMDETITVAKNTAQVDYLSKKKATPKLPSMIIESFTYNGPQLNSSGVTGIVFYDIVKAPYAIYVDQGHLLRNGIKWEGYHSMKAGQEEGYRVAVSIIAEKLSRIM